MINFTVGQTVDNKAALTGCLKGTMKSDTTYYVGADICVSQGDTLVVQPGAKIIFNGNYNFIIKGTLLSLGTAAKPIYFTYKDQTKTDAIGEDTLLDSAYKGLWGGIMGETTSPKWTHQTDGTGNKH